MRGVAGDGRGRGGEAAGEVAIGEGDAGRVGVGGRGGGRRVGADHVLDGADAGDRVLGEGKAMATAPTSLPSI